MPLMKLIRDFTSIKYWKFTQVVLSVVVIIVISNAVWYQFELIEWIDNYFDKHCS